MSVNQRTNQLARFSKNTPLLSLNKLQKIAIFGSLVFLVNKILYLNQHYT